MPRDPSALVGLGGAIRATRVQAGVSQRELARRTGLNHQTISKIELGATDPSYSILSQVAAGLEIPLSALILVAEGGLTTRPRAAR